MKGDFVRSAKEVGSIVVRFLLVEGVEVSSQAHRLVLRDVKIGNAAAAQEISSKSLVFPTSLPSSSLASIFIVIIY